MQKEAPIINAWLAHYNQKHGTDYQISEFPDETNRNSAEVDAIARDGDHPPLAIEETLLMDPLELPEKPLLHKKSRLMDYRERGYCAVLLISTHLNEAERIHLTRLIEHQSSAADHLDVVYLTVHQASDAHHKCLKDLSG